MIPFMLASFFIGFLCLLVLGAYLDMRDEGTDELERYRKHSAEGRDNEG